MMTILYYIAMPFYHLMMISAGVIISLARTRGAPVFHPQVIYVNVRPWWVRLALWLHLRPAISFGWDRQNDSVVPDHEWLPSIWAFPCVLLPWETDTRQPSLHPLRKCP